MGRVLIVTDKGWALRDAIRDREDQNYIINNKVFRDEDLFINLSRGSEMDLRLLSLAGQGVLSLGDIVDTARLIYGEDDLATRYSERVRSLIRHGYLVKDKKVRGG